MEHDQRQNKFKMFFMLAMISVSIVFAICSAIDVVYRYHDVTDEIINETLSIVDDGNWKFHENNLHDDGIYDADYYVGENSHISSLQELHNWNSSDLDFTILAITIGSSIAMVLCTYRINQIKENNVKLATRYTSMVEALDTENVSILDHAINKKKIKKMINPGVWLIIPAFVGMLMMMIVNIIITQYGIRTTNAICGVVEHYEMIHVPQAIHQLNAIDGVHITAFDTPQELQASIPPKLGTMTLSLDDDEPSSKSHTVKVSDNSRREGSYLYNYRELPCGISISVQYDIKPYQIMTWAWTALFVTYLLVYAMASYENKLAVCDL